MLSELISKGDSSYRRVKLEDAASKILKTIDKNEEKHIPIDLSSQPPHLRIFDERERKVPSKIEKKIQNRSNALMSERDLKTRKRIMGLINKKTKKVAVEKKRIRLEKSIEVFSNEKYDPLDTSNLCKRIKK